MKGNKFNNCVDLCRDHCSALTDYRLMGRHNKYLISPLPTALLSLPEQNLGDRPPHPDDTGGDVKLDDLSSVIEHDDSNTLEEFFRQPMSFGTENLTLITTQVGATAHIPCVVHYIGDGVVSWIRRKDYHLLTVALTTYSSDERFSATHLKTSEDWTLQIKFVQPRDAGTYECQVSSTHPPQSIFLHLNVIEARAEIIGPTVRYLTPDSTLRLICRVIQSTETSEFLFWYQDDRMINYDTDRGVNISTEPDYNYSELTIMRATKHHSGNYSCVPSNAQPASVTVHIFKGDNPAAMHHDHVNGSPARLQITQKWPIWTTTTLLVMLFIGRHNWSQMDVFHTTS
ncbi:Zwei Ig domain protein zig-8 [Sergentomyia squamirostris]